jgi:hypothetical protein
MCIKAAPYSIKEVLIELNMLLCLMLMLHTKFIPNSTFRGAVLAYILFNHNAKFATNIL